MRSEILQKILDSTTQETIDKVMEYGDDIVRKNTLKLIRVADIKEYLPQLDREEITLSRFAEILNEVANKNLKNEKYINKI